MKRKIALKRLTRSDLTFFKWHFENDDAGNQKAINLNADVFVDQLFPAAPLEANAHSGRFSIDLDIFGPGGAPALNLQRKIIKLGAYKNWRLDGEFVDNPLTEPTRFNALQEGDFALIEFTGVHYPESARLCLVDVAGSGALHSICNDALGARRMMALDPDALENILKAAGANEDFAIAGSSIEVALEDAAQGGIDGVRQLIKRSISRPISKEELRQALAKADDNGNMGEEFVNEHLTKEQAAKRIDEFTWVSQTNAIEPFDFETKLASNKGRIDVKSTSGGFGSKLHISLNELLHMRDPECEYLIYRVYAINDGRATLRISEPMLPFANTIVPLLEVLPAGVNADGISVSPSVLKFGPEVMLTLTPSEE